jgi:hypothetical protein
MFNFNWFDEILCTVSYTCYLPHNRYHHSIPPMTYKVYSPHEALWNLIKGWHILCVTRLINMWPTTKDWTHNSRQGIHLNQDTVFLSLINKKQIQNEKWNVVSIPSHNQITYVRIQPLSHLASLSFWILLISISGQPRSDQLPEYTPQMRSHQQHAVSKNYNKNCGNSHADIHLKQIEAV